MQANAIALLQDVDISDIARVGGKNASLGEMMQHLTKLGIAIPEGFVITVDAFQQFMEASDLHNEIQQRVAGIQPGSVESLRRAGLQIRSLIRNSRFPKELAADIIDAYHALSAKYRQSNTDVAVRSSATTEDLPNASFAGQQETYLNVRGETALIDAVRNCFASLYTDRAISYRRDMHFEEDALGLSVCVQKMVRSDLGTSGVAFSLDTESGFKDIVLINGSYGLGELIVQGTVAPDEFMVFKPTLKEGYEAIIEKKLGAKDLKMVYGGNPDERVKTIPVEPAARHRFCMDDATILKLARWVMLIENYYSIRHNRWCPMDVEWAVDGLSNELFILQARPETVHAQKSETYLQEYDFDPQGAKLLLKGIAVGDKIATGKVKRMYSLDKRVGEGTEFLAGDVLVTEMTDPDWEPIMKKAAAIITERGGRTCHAAIVARELGVPAVVGTRQATAILQNGASVTVSCAEGDTGLVYEGIIPYRTTAIDVQALPRVKTALMLNVASPEMAFRFSLIPNKGVGLAREEFIINNYIGVHPLAVLPETALPDPALAGMIRQKAAGFANAADFFIGKLSYGIARIAAAVYPHPCVVRFSDFKSNEYSNLPGGAYFEPQEENPMMGWRGASRYYAESFKQAFGLECKAIVKARSDMGLKNIVVMIPFCRTVAELVKVQEVMAEFGLVRGADDLQVYLMAELPSNIILARSFARHIDGFSIGSNDLTQLTLGLDRDSSLVAHLYDERNEAVKALLSHLIWVAKEEGVKVGICGQGPSDHSDLAQFLVEQGIDSISVTPDALVKTINAVAAIEEEIVRHGKKQQPFPITNFYARIVGDGPAEGLRNG